MHGHLQHDHIFIDLSSNYSIGLRLFGIWTARITKQLLIENTVLLLRTKQRPKRFDFALEFGAAHLHIVSLSLDFLELRLEARHLVDTLLSVATCRKSIGFPLLDTRRVGS
jgi:hypothetical protein